MPAAQAIGTRILQTVETAAKRGLTRGHLMNTFAQHGGGAAVRGFLGQQAMRGAMYGAAGGAALGFGANAVGNMANGDSPFRGGFGAAFRGAALGGVGGAAGGAGSAMFGRSRAYARFMGQKGAMGQFYRREAIGVGKFSSEVTGRNLYMGARHAAGRQYGMGRGKVTGAYGRASGWFGKGAG